MSHTLVTDADAAAFRSERFGALHSRLVDSWDAQQTKLTAAQSAAAASEQRISALQAELRQLASDVQTKEAQVERDAAALTTLRA